MAKQDIGRITKYNIYCELRRTGNSGVVTDNTLKLKNRKINKTDLSSCLSIISRSSLVGKGSVRSAVPRRYKKKSYRAYCVVKENNFPFITLLDLHMAFHQKEQQRKRLNDIAYENGVKKAYYIITNLSSLHLNIIGINISAKS